MTRPETFQSLGCLPKDTIPERIVSSTPLFDLSTVYGNFVENLDVKGRLFQRGLLKHEEEKGRVWPPSSKTPVHLCVGNQLPQETRCHDMPEDGANTLAGISLMTIWYWRNHNFIANELFRINPCWDDEMLFATARDINIAIFNQINYYELMPLFLGCANLLRDGILSPSAGFRDIYNKTIEPRMSLEFSFVLRWMHTIQEGTLKMYDRYGFYLKQIPIANLTLRTGYLAVDNNIDYITQGSFRQGSGKVDYIADPDMTDRALGPYQKAADVMTNDLAKNRYFGFQPYIRYRETCFGKLIRTFDDLHGIIDPERIEILKDVYEKEIDIDLMAGIWVEKPIPEGYVPSTFYCLVIDQLRRNIVSDRHWYERSQRPRAFNEPVLCDVKAALFYDSYHGVPIDVSEVKRRDKSNTTFWCVNEIEPCDPLEGRRVDGSCNNLKYPSRGASHTPFTRILPPIYDKDFEPKKSASGNDLPLPRSLRTRLISVGKVPSQRYTQLALHAFTFLSADVVSLHDTVNYILWRPYCCTPKGKTDSICVPNKVPEDDPVHRFSGIRCLNMIFSKYWMCAKGHNPRKNRFINSTYRFIYNLR
ncbi:hypothetical protein PYW07_015647 [Mythimna separata]|uniref:Peroxidase n=1 Tax=Mythimna separata TaxID=271217 RepID=A0AAD7Z1C7_MYTSE|nr:hypothetical protein PYW07_015647 [Mythimna separata]